MLYSVLRDFSFIPLLTLFISIYVSKTKRNSAGFQFSHPEAAKLSFSSCRRQRCCCFHRTFFLHFISYHIIHISHMRWTGLLKQTKKDNNNWSINEKMIGGNQYTWWEKNRNKIEFLFDISSIGSVTIISQRIDADILGRRECNGNMLLTILPLIILLSEMRKNKMLSSRETKKNLRISLYEFFWMRKISFPVWLILIHKILRFVSLVFFICFWHDNVWKCRMRAH